MLMLLLRVGAVGMAMGSSVLLACLVFVALVGSDAANTELILSAKRQRGSTATRPPFYLQQKLIY